MALKISFKTFLFVFLIHFCNVLSAQNPFFPVISQDNICKFIDLKGNEVLTLKMEITDAKPFYEGLSAIKDKKTELFGYIDTKGNWAIKPTYITAGNFNKGMAVVATKCQKNCLTDGAGLLNSEQTMLIDKKGNITLEDNSQDPEPSKRFWFSDYNQDERLVSIVGLGVGEFQYLMNRKGERMGERLASFGKLNFLDGLFCYSFAREPYYADINGKKVLDAKQYAFVTPFSEGFAWVVKHDQQDENPKDILIDKKGKEILVLDQKTQQMPKKVGSGLFPIVLAKNSTPTQEYAYFDIKGKKTINTHFYKADPFSNGLAHVMTTKENIGYIDKKGKMVVEIQNPELKIFSFGEFQKEGYAFFYDEKENILFIAGIILRDGKTFFLKEK